MDMRRPTWSPRSAAPFAAAWIFASAVGFASIILAWMWADSASTLVPEVFVPACSGVLVAIPQWLVLRPYGQPASRWVLMTGLATVVGLLATGASFLLAAVILGLVVSIARVSGFQGSASILWLALSAICVGTVIVGLSQYAGLVAMLDRLPRHGARVWAAATTVSILGSIGSVFPIVGRFEPGPSLLTPHSVYHAVVLWAASGVAYGLPTAMAMVWLLRDNEAETPPSRIERRVLVSAAALFTLAILAPPWLLTKAEPKTSGTITVTTRYVPLPRDWVSGDVAWMSAPENRIVMSHASGPGAASLYLLDHEGSTLQPVIMQRDPRCPNERYGIGPRLELLEDGRLAHLHRCNGREPEGPPQYSLATYDLATEALAILIPYRLPASTSRFALAPNAGSGALGVAPTQPSSLAWLLPDRPEPINVPLESVSNPRWSPDSRSIVLEGIVDRAAARRSSSDDLPRNAYLLSPDTLALQTLIDDVPVYRVFNWSPDSRWLVVAVRNTVREGYWERRQIVYWLCEVETSRRYHLDLPIQRSVNIVWSPDGRQLAALVAPGSGDSSGEPSVPPGLYIVDLPDLDQLTGRR